MKNMQSIPLPCILCFLPRALDLIFYCLCLLLFRAVTQLLILPFPPRLTLQTGKGKWKKAPFAAATAVPPPFSLAETFRFPFLFPLHLRAKRERERGKSMGGREAGPTDRPMGSLPGDPPPPPPPPASPFPPCCCCCFCSLSHREG